MAKYDFNLSTYAKLWDSIEGQQLMTYILNNPDMIRQNNTVWRSFFGVDNKTFPVAADGTASFTMTARQIKPATMAHLRAPLGDTITQGAAEFEKFSGTIPDFISDGTVEKAMEREYKEDLYSQLAGNDASMLVEFATTVLQTKQDQLNATLSNLAMQMMSKGNCVYTYGQGTNGALLKMPLGADHFLGAGTAVWTASGCKVLTQMRAIEKKVREDILGDLDIALEWHLPYNIYWDVFMKNDEVKDYVKDRIYIEKGVKVDNPLLLTNGDYSQWLTGIDGLSPIKVVSEHQFDGKTKVNGWKTGVVTLTPAGLKGKIVRKEILDKKILDKYGNNTVAQRAWAMDQTGLILFQNVTLLNGQLKEWQSSAMMSAIPVLDEWPYHFIIDTTTAG